MSAIMKIAELGLVSCFKHTHTICAEVVFISEMVYLEQS